MRNDLTYEQVREMFDYDPFTGLLTWKIERYRKHPGDVAGCKHTTYGKNYKRINVSINYRRYLAHRVIWLWMTGKWPDKEIDHIDNDAWNNRWDNLREASHSQNAKNLNKRTYNPFPKGVSRAKGNKYRARITVGYKEIQLGTFDTVEEANAAYLLGSKKYHGEFAKLE